MRLVLSSLVALVLGAGAAVGSPAASPYSNQQTYGNAASASIVAPPTGFDLFFVEMIARHGSRSLTSPDAEKRVLALWEKARRAGALTSTGKQLKTDVLTFQYAERKVGYGELSTVGGSEWAGIGRRFAAVYSDFLAKAQASGDSMVYVTTPVLRTKQSAGAERWAIRKAGFGTLDARSTTAVDDRMVIESGSTATGRAAIAKARSTSSAKAAARSVLATAYSSSFVKSVKDPVSAAMDLYLLFCTAPGMAADSAVTFASYVPSWTRPYLAQVKDTENFYRFGPGVAGQRSTFAAADPLLRSFFDAIDQRIAGSRKAVVLRHAHGETIMPFAARIRIDGSTKQAWASTPYTWSNNPWRGSQAGRLGGNIEWAVYRKAGTYLVTVRYHEQPARLAGCTIASGTSWFYTLPELKRCLKS